MVNVQNPLEHIYLLLPSRRMLPKQPDKYKLEEVKTITDVMGEVYNTIFIYTFKIKTACSTAGCFINSERGIRTLDTAGMNRVL